VKINGHFLSFLISVLFLSVLDLSGDSGTILHYLHVHYFVNELNQNLLINDLAYNSSAHFNFF